MYNDYVSYLNSLHNYNAQNENSYAEKNFDNQYYSKVMVKIGLSDYFVKQIQTQAPHVIILTGHAGDGKTSIMYQVLQKFGYDPKHIPGITDLNIGSSKKCRFVRDFSELNDEEKKNELSTLLKKPSEGEYAFIVANTGPLLKTFEQLDLSESNDEVSELIEQMDRSDGNITNIADIPISVVNMTCINNTFFAIEYINNLVNDDLWAPCEQCNKKQFCHIYRNYRLIKLNRTQINHFFELHFNWLAENGNRLTVRSIAEQLSFMITGGDQCQNVVDDEPQKKLSSNLFFGYYDLMPNPESQVIMAINDTHRCHYDSKKLRADMTILIERDYKSVFGEELVPIIERAYSNEAFQPGWSQMMRRLYLFYNCSTDLERRSEDVADVFSEKFMKYLDLITGKTTPSGAERSLIADALMMIYTGSLELKKSPNSTIPVTLSRESGITQSVQLVLGSIFSKKINIKQVETKDALFGGGDKRYRLQLSVDGKTVCDNITLPLWNYFNDLKNGIIPTNIDPELTHGIENIKASINKIISDDTDESISLLVVRSNSNETIGFTIEGDTMREE